MNRARCTAFFPAAVINAVVDALAHLGVKHVDMPATSEKIWRIIQDATA